MFYIHDWLWWNLLYNVPRNIRLKAQIIVFKHTQSHALKISNPQIRKIILLYPIRVPPESITFKFTFDNNIFKLTSIYIQTCPSSPTVQLNTRLNSSQTTPRYGCYISKCRSRHLNAKHVFKTSSLSWIFTNIINLKKSLLIWYISGFVKFLLLYQLSITISWVV